MIRNRRPARVATVGDVVSRETLAAGIQVNLRIVDQMTLRKSIEPIKFKAERTYRVKNPAGLITQEAWDAIKDSFHYGDAVIFVEGEEDLLAIPTILESPDNAFTVYGQPSQGIVVVTASPAIRREVWEMMNRMTRE